MSKSSTLSPTLTQQIISWESAFHTIHNRKPNKNDIDLVPGHLRDSYICYCTTRKTNPDGLVLKRQASFRLKRDEFDFSAKRKITRRSADSVGNLDNKSLSVGNIGESVQSSENAANPTFRLLDEIRADDSKHYYTLEPLNKLRPKINKCFLSEPDWLDDNITSRDWRSAHTNLPTCVDFSKRRRMCEFLISNGVEEAETSSTKSAKEENDDDGSCDESANRAFIDSAGFFGTITKRPRRKLRSNENFTKLNLKQKRFAPISKIARKLKGAALKRFLYKMKRAKENRRR